MNDGIAALCKKLMDEYPDVKTLMENSDTPEVKAEKLIEFVERHPELTERFATLQREQNPTPMWAVDPLAQAALAERLQFDGDIPELRTGSLPKGVRPAVSVDTTVKSPEALGVMLEQASLRVMDEIENFEPIRQQLIQDTLEGGLNETLVALQRTETGLSATQAADLVLNDQTSVLDVPSYRRGEVPAKVSVPEPEGSQLLKMTPEERKQGAWRFLSTTQGRRTAEGTIGSMIAERLTREGFEVHLRPLQPLATHPVLASHEWTVMIDGPGAVQPAFNLVDVASAAIAKGLTRMMGDRRGRVTLEVAALNTVSARGVGWCGRLLGMDPVLS